MTRYAALRNERDGSIVAERVARAANPWTRLVGLLGRATVAADEGLWIAGCSAVHTMGMRAAIDCYFLDRDDRVLKIARAVPPGKLAVTCSGAKTVVELGAGDHDRDIRAGDRLALS